MRFRKEEIFYHFYFVFFSVVFFVFLTQKLAFINLFFQVIYQNVTFAFLVHPQLSQETNLAGKNSLEILILLPSILSAGVIVFIIFLKKLLSKNSQFLFLPAPLYLLILSIFFEIYQVNKFLYFLFANIFFLAFFHFFITGIRVVMGVLKKFNAPVFVQGAFFLFLIFAYPAGVFTGIMSNWFDFEKAAEKLIMSKKA